ncbi:MAG: recombinase family protein [Polaromonas sp.]|nr:recombinase family protein [Polaromonas sp.]
MTGVTSADLTLHIYTRVSTVAQAEQGTSLESQRELGVKKANDLGFEFKVWNEGGRSSHHENIADRPELNSLYVAMKAGLVKHLWVYDQSRLSRNDNVASVFRYECNKQGVTLYTKDGQFDLSSPQDKFLKQLLDAVAEFDNVTRAERTRLGKLSRVRSGSWHGGPPPYGYKLVDKKLVVVEDESIWVKRIFHEVVKGSAATHIKGMLDSNGVSPRRKKGLWTIGSINALLKNTHYSGHYIYTDSKSNQKIEVQCPSIVDQTIWNAAQHKRSSEVLRQSQKNATEKNFYMLRDFMHCGHCGRPISGRIIKARAESSYYCPNKERAWVVNGGSDTPWQRGLSCGFARAMNIHQTDKLVWDLVTSLHSKSSTLKEEVKHRLLKESGIMIRTDVEIRAIQAKIRRLQKHYASMSDTLGNLEANKLIGKINDVSYETTLKRIREEVGKTETELASVRLELGGTAESRKWVNWLKAFGDEVEKLDALTDVQKKEYLGGLVKRIDVLYDNEKREHQMTLHMHLPIVNDGIKKNRSGLEGREYDVVPGADMITLVSKKKDGRG